MSASPAPSFQSENDLIVRALRGEMPAFYDLMHPYEHCIFIAARSLTASDAEAEELAQQVVMQAFAELAHRPSDCKFAAWLLQLTMQQAHARLGPHQQPAGEQNGDYVPRNVDDWHEIPLRALQQTAVRQALADSLFALPTAEREVLVLRDVEQLSISETARVLGLAESTVKTRLLRARLMLRDALAPGLSSSGGVIAIPRPRAHDSKQAPKELLR